MDWTPWVMAAHIATLGLWSAALLIMAGLYAWPPDADDRAEVHRHALMCRHTFMMLGSPTAVLAILTGSALVALRGVDGSWLLGKLAAVALLALFHVYCGHLLHEQQRAALPRPPVWKRPVLFLVPVLLISTIFVLVLAKPDVVLEHQIAPKPSGYGHQQGAQQGQIQTAAMNGGHRVIQTRQPIDERYRQQHDCHHEMAPAGRAVPDSPNDQEFQCAYDAG